MNYAAMAAMGQGQMNWAGMQPQAMQQWLAMQQSQQQMAGQYGCGYGAPCYGGYAPLGQVAQGMGGCCGGGYWGDQSQGVSYGNDYQADHSAGTAGGQKGKGKGGGQG